VSSFIRKGGRRGFAPRPKLLPASGWAGRRARYLRPVEGGEGGEEVGHLCHDCGARGVVTVVGPGWFFASSNRYLIEAGVDEDFTGWLCSDCYAESHWTIELVEVIVVECDRCHEEFDRPSAYMAHKC
jgi:hypothetical protein